MRVVDILLWLQRDATEDEIRQVLGVAESALISASKDKLFFFEEGQRVRYTDADAPRLNLRRNARGVILKISRDRVTVRFDKNPNGPISLPPHMVELDNAKEWKEPVNAADRVEGRPIEPAPEILCDHPPGMVIEVAGGGATYCLRCKRLLT